MFYIWVHVILQWLISAELHTEIILITDEKVFTSKRTVHEITSQPIYCSDENFFHHCSMGQLTVIMTNI